MRSPKDGGGVGVGTTVTYFNEEAVTGATKVVALSTCVNAVTNGRVVDAGNMKAIVCFGLPGVREALDLDSLEDIKRNMGMVKEILEDSFCICDILKINDEELVVVSRMFGYDGLDMRGTCEKIVQDYHLKMLVLTCGTNGSYVFTDDGLTSFQDTPKVEVADTVGAGDSFTGSFCACILNGKPVQEAHKTAVQISAFVCTQNGAMPTIPKEFI